VIQVELWKTDRFRFWIQKYYYLVIELWKTNRFRFWIQKYYYLVNMLNPLQSLYDIYLKQCIFLNCKLIRLYHTCN